MFSIIAVDRGQVSSHLVTLGESMTGVMLNPLPSDHLCASSPFAARHDDLRVLAFSNSTQLKIKASTAGREAVDLAFTEIIDGKWALCTRRSRLEVGMQLLDLRGDVVASQYVWVGETNEYEAQKLPESVWAHWLVAMIAMVFVIQNIAAFLSSAPPRRTGSSQKRLANPSQASSSGAQSSCADRW
jgi:hypothetical protein